MASLGVQRESCWIWNLQKARVPTPSRTISKRGWGLSPPTRLLRGRCRYGGGCRVSRNFRRHRVDLHGRQNLLQAIENPVAVDVLHQAFVRGIGGHVQRELVAGSVLIHMEELRVALARSLPGHSLGG